MRASVVFPVPGGPQRMMDVNWSCSTIMRRTLPSPIRWSCPTISSRVRGRRRSASGDPGVTGSSAGSGKSDLVIGRSGSDCAGAKTSCCLYPFVRCRKASNRIIAPAIATFSDSTSSAIGMRMAGSPACTFVRDAAAFIPKKNRAGRLQIRLCVCGSPSQDIRAVQLESSGRLQ